MLRVIIERNIREGCFNDYFELIRRARKQATINDGFIAGELLQEKSNQNHTVIISSWENFEAWQMWQQSEERKQVLNELKPFLEDEEKVTVLEASQMLS